MAIGGSPPNAPREKDGTKGTAGRYGFVAEILRGYLGGLWLARDANDSSDRGTVLVHRIAPIPTASARAALLEAARWGQAAGGPTLEIIEGKTGVDLVTPFPDAEPLRSLLRTAALKHVPLDPGVLLGMARDILGQLESLHDTARSDKSAHGFGGVHPDSILVGTDGHVRLIDAGVCAAASAREPWKSDVQRVGYFAPEQVEARGVVDARTDVFALGILLWEAFGNRRLFPGADAKTARERVQKGVIARLDAARGTGSAGIATPIADLVARALEREPAKRFQTAAEMEAAIGALEPADPARIGAWVASLADTVIAKRRQLLERIAQGGALGGGAMARPSSTPSARSSVTPPPPSVRSSVTPPPPSVRPSVTPPPPSVRPSVTPPPPSPPSVRPSAPRPSAAAEPGAAPVSSPAEDSAPVAPAPPANEPVTSEPESAAPASPHDSRAPATQPSPGAAEPGAAEPGGTGVGASDASASGPSASDAADEEDADAMDVTDDELGAPPPPSSKPAPPAPSMRPSPRTSLPPRLPEDLKHAMDLEGGDTSLLGAPAEPLAGPMGAVSQLATLTRPAASRRRGRLVLAVGAALVLGVGVGGWWMGTRGARVRIVNVTPTLEAHVESITAVVASGSAAAASAAPPAASAAPSSSAGPEQVPPAAASAAPSASALPSAEAPTAEPSATPPSPTPSPEHAEPASKTPSPGSHPVSGQPAAPHRPPPSRNPANSGYKPGGI